LVFDSLSANAYAHQQLRVPLLNHILVVLALCQRVQVLHHTA